MTKLTLYILVALNICTLNSKNLQDFIKDSSNFYSIRQAYLDFKKENNDKISAEPGKDGIDAKFSRWEYFMEPRVFPSGKFPQAGILLSELNKFNRDYPQTGDSIVYGDWKPLETPEGFPKDGYSGRLNCIAFHPADTNIIFVGSPSGGLWKTTDGGECWAPLTDKLPSLGVSEIVINPINPEIMYMATGDRDIANFISNPYSYGILKSTDGGITWDTTGLNHVLTEEMTIQRLVMHPDNPEILMAAVVGVKGSLRGLWRTTDAGKTWKNVSGGAKYDIEFKPGNPDIVYASGWKTMLRSTDAGETWSVINYPILPSIDNSHAKIAVTPAAPDIVYIQYIVSGKTYGVYKSTDSGLSWERKNKLDINIQGGFDWVFSASPVNPNLIFYAGVEFYYSTDGGSSSSMYNSGHVDHHGIDFHPVTKALFNCTDGGLYKSYTNGREWINLNKCLQTFQYYRLGASVTNKDFILTGAQDNGTWMHKKTSRERFGILADGAECIIDYSDPSIYYVSYQYAFLNRYGDVPGTCQPPPDVFNPSFWAWITPYIIHPTNPEVLFIGGKDVYKTRNRGNSWNKYSHKLTQDDLIGGGVLRWLAISESTPDSVMYATSYVAVYKTTDGGASWQNVVSNLPVSAGCIDCSALSCIVVHPTKPEKVWVTMSGYSKNNKVFKTENGGASWENISSNLPDAPVNCIVYEKNSSDRLYIGTDIGVFYHEAGDSLWKPYMNGLPNVPVLDLEIHYGTSKIRAATFGRGLWESNLKDAGTDVEFEERIQNDIILYPNPAKDIVELNLMTNMQVSENIKFIKIYNSIGDCVKTIESSSSPVNKIDIAQLNPGVYTFVINTSSGIFHKKLMIIK